MSFGKKHTKKKTTLDTHDRLAGVEDIMTIPLGDGFKLDRIKAMLKLDDRRDALVEEKAVKEPEPQATSTTYDSE